MEGGGASISGSYKSRGRSGYDLTAPLARYVAANPGHSFEVGGDLHWWWLSLRAEPGFQAVLDRR